MASNTIKINLGSLGSLGGEGNLGNASIHDSTCLCEGCLEKRLADREFTIGSNPFVKPDEKDFGFNKDDNDEEPDLIVLDSDDDCHSVSDIFDINDDPPSDDGYCDDGEDSEDTYSVFSPKPCTINEQDELGLDDIEEEDMPPVSVEESINDASIEASKKDGSLVEECFDLVEDQGHESVHLRQLHTALDEDRFKAASYWKGQVERYETKIMNMFKTVTKYAEGIHAAKRRMDYDAYEIHRLRDPCMDKTKECNDKDERIYQVTDAMCLMEHHYQLKEKRKEREYKALERNLQLESSISDQLRQELRATRERLNTFTRRSVPHRTKRTIQRRVSTYDDGDEDSSITLGSCSNTEYEDDDVKTSKLVKIMDYDD